MRPVTIRKPLSSLRSARNLREYYDVLRIEAGLPARSPVPECLKFLHRPKPRPKPHPATKSPPPHWDTTEVAMNQHTVARAP
jgi:hypothetical protein